MEDTITAIAKYLIVKRLSGDIVTILAIKEYLVDGLSPSTIGHKYKISKFKVRGYVQRVVDKARNHRVAARIVEALFPHIIAIDPIMIRAGNRVICLLCDAAVRVSDAEFHIKRKHKELVNSLIKQVITRARRSG
jgi:hypothetical protein